MAATRIPEIKGRLGQVDFAASRPLLLQCVRASCAKEVEALLKTHLLAMRASRC